MGRVCYGPRCPGTDFTEHGRDKISTQIASFVQNQPRYLQKKTTKKRRFAHSHIRYSHQKEMMYVPT